ncbi:hypothetical protein CPB86DRAFT_712777 [Serendipita vermifera]|nr:hypothetical protein CPB86DRAFT_712777 [Serendipita vermifera]
MKVFTSFLTAASLLASGVVGLAERGNIDQPANGTHVAPGSWVPFYYRTMAEYSWTSYNFSVWLFTSDPKEALFTGGSTGISLGKWSYSSSTNTNPPNPSPPAQIYIPDFSKGQGGYVGGFGGGMNASDATIWLAVFEEYGHAWVSVVYPSENGSCSHPRRVLELGSTMRTIT